MNMTQTKWNLIVFIVGAFIILAWPEGAQTQGKFSAEIGYMPNNGAVGIRNGGHSYNLDYDDTLYTKLAATIPVLKYGFINGEVATSMLPQARPDYWLGFDFIPMDTTYTFGAGVQVGDFTVGYTHACSHPIDCNWLLLIYGNASYDQFYVRYEVKF